MNIKLSMETITQLEELAKQLNLGIDFLINHIVEPEAYPLPTKGANG